MRKKVGLTIVEQAIVTVSGFENVEKNWNSKLLFEARAKVP